MNTSRKPWAAGLLCWAVSSAMALEINAASEAELDGLKGIGPPFTRRLMSARAQQPFQNWPDLMRRVSGMGPRIAKSLSDQGLTVNGQPLFQGQPPTENTPTADASASSIR